jgi:hypothetical protein
MASESFERIFVMGAREPHRGSARPWLRLWGFQKNPSQTEATVAIDGLAQLAQIRHPIKGKSMG